MSKKFISIFLIVSMVFANNGISVLASSIEDVVVENQSSATEGTKLYYEESEENIVVDVIDDAEEIDKETFDISENNKFENEVEEEVEVETEKESEEEIEELEDVIASESESESESELEDETELETKEEIENDIASESEAEEENEIATESEIEEVEEENLIATESEIATIAEAEKEIVVATISKVTWKVIKIFIATYSSARINIEKENESIEARLATQANVLVENNFGDQKIIKVDLSWKLDKKYEVNARSEGKKDAVKAETWKEKFEVDKYIDENKNVIMTATSNIADIEEEVKKENENFVDKEVVIVVETEKAEEESEIVEINESVKTNEIEEIENIKTIEDIEETDGIKIIDETEVVEETVEGFDGTEETPSEIIEIEKDEIKTVATVNIVDYEIESGTVGNDSIKDVSLAHYDVQAIEYWAIDMDKLSESLLNALMNENVNDGLENETETAAEINTETSKNGILDTIFKGINNLFTSSQNESVASEVPEEKTATDVAKNLSALKTLQAIAPAPVGNPIVEVTNFRTTIGATHTGGNTHAVISMIENTKIDLTTIDNTTTVWTDIYEIDQSQVGTGSQIKVEGKYYLTDDNFKIDKHWAVPDNKKLFICLNGHKLTFAVEKGEPRSGGSEGTIERFINNDNSLGTTGEVYICNCDTENISHISAEPPVYGMTDKFFASTSEVYTKYKEKSLISAPKVYVFGKNENIVFDNNIIKNRYTGYHARNQIIVPEEDYPLNGGGGSILQSTVDMKIVGVRFENNIATRTNGVAINAMQGKLSVDKSYFKNNVNNSSKGGAIALNPMSAEIYDSTFEENVSNTVGGAIFGKAFTNAFVGNGTVIENVTFKNNKALRDGGAIYFDDFGPGKIITIGGSEESKKCTFVGNTSGTKGGAIAVKNIVEDTTGGYEGFIYNPPNEGTLKIENCEFDGNTCKDLTNNNTSLDNKGGAISLDNYNFTKKILKTVEIKNTLFKNNKAEGKELDIHKYNSAGAIEGETGYKLTLQSYGGAIFASGFDDNDHKIKLEKVEMNENEATTGANLCLNKAIVELKECNIHDNKFTKAYKGGTEIDLTNSPNGRKNLADLSITPGGGAAYLMNGAKLYVDKDTTITNNLNALYLDNADIEIAGESINGNVGEYIVGANNKTANTVTFDTVNIIDNGGETGPDGWKADGRIINRKKDYYDDTNAKTKADKLEVFTKVLFKGDFLTINNNERKYSNQSGLALGASYTYDKSEECNIDIRSTVSNLQLDLSQHRFTISEDRIGLHYDIEEALTDPKIYAYMTWNPTHVAGYNYGDLWHTLFTLDNSDSGETYDRWGYIKDDTNPERIVIVSGITRVHFNSYIQGARQIASQFYQIKAPEGTTEQIKISMPTELQNAAYNTGGKTVLGFVGKHTKDQVDWDPWDFDTDKVTVSSDDTDIEFIAIYADSQIKVKSCGLPNDVPCNHPDGSIHELRGGKDAHEEAAKYTNYVLVATYAQLSYKYKNNTDPTNPKNNKRTQYMLDKDIFFDAALAEKYIHGDIILNLNGKTLSVDCSGTNTPIFKASSSDTPEIAIQDYSEKTHIYIVGRATTATTEKGKIVFVNSENVTAPLIDTNGKSIYMTDVQIDGYTGTNTSLIQSVAQPLVDGNKIVIDNCDIKNIETKNTGSNNFNTITGAQKIYFTNSKFSNVTNTKANFVTPTFKDGVSASAVGYDNKTLVEINKSTISVFKGKSIYSITNGMASGNYDCEGEDVIIASSSIADCEFTDDGISVSAVGEFTNESNSKLIFRGINLIKNDNAKTAGKSIIVTDQAYIFDDENGETTFEDNTVTINNSFNGYIMNMQNDVNPSILNGGLIIKNNKIYGTSTMNKSAALYFSEGASGGLSKIKLEKCYLYVDNNGTETKPMYNIFIENSEPNKESEVFYSDVDTKFDVSKSKLNIGLATNDYEQLLYKDYKEENIIGDTRIENLFTRSSDTPTNYNTYRKANVVDVDNVDIYFGKEFVTGRFKLYDYSNAATDERDSGVPYDVDIYNNYEHRVASWSTIRLDKINISSETDDIYWSKGLYVENPTDISKEYVIHKNTEVIRVNENKDFIISGYRSKPAKHIHANTGNQDWWLEARNEAHLQPCTESYIFLHNDITITHPLFDNANSKLDNEYRICLNGHKLILANDIDWLTTTENVNVEICDCQGTGSIEQNRTKLPKYHKEFINMNNGKLNLQDIKVLNFDVLSDGVSKAGFIDMNSSTYNINGELGIKNVDFNGNKAEATASDIGGLFINAYNFATQSVINSKFTGNTFVSKNNEQYFLKYSINNAEDKSEIVDGLEINSNTTEGEGSFVRFEDYKNYLFKNTTINNNTVYGGSPISIKGRGTNETELGFTDVKFEGNKKKAKAEFVISSPNSANIEFTGIKKLTVDTGSFKNASYDTSGIVDAATVSTVLHVGEDTEVHMYNVTFDGNNAINPTAKSSKAFYFDGSKDVKFENCTFKGGNAEKSDLIEIGENYTGNVKFIGTTNFNNVKARYIINVKSQNAVLELKNTVINGSNAERVINLERTGAKLTLDGVNANNNIVTNNKEFAYIAAGAMVLSSGSNILNTNGRVFNILTNIATLYNTTIQGNGSNAGPAIDLSGNLILGDKVIIKGYQRNLRFLTTGKIAGDINHKIVDGSEIYITGNIDNYNFFDGWGANYIENFGKHNPTSMDINDWSYLPERIFKVDDTNNIIYKEGINPDRKLYICNKTSDKYVTLKFVDEEERPELGYSIYQYIAASPSGATNLDFVQVGYLSTSSQAWKHYFDPVSGISSEAYWRIKDGMLKAINVESGEYVIKLAKVHIHYECGTFMNTECHHVDGIVHNDEIEFYEIYSPDKIASASDGTNAFGLKNDMTFTQADIDEIVSRAGAKDTIYLCLEGKKLTFADNAKFGSAKKLVITNCEDETYLTVATESYISYPIIDTGSNDLRIYRTKIKNIKATNNNTIFSAAGNIVIENVSIENCESDSDKGLIDISGTAQINNVKITGNTINDNASHNSILYNASQEYTKVNNFDIENNIYNTKLVKVTTSKFGNINVKNNKIVVSTDSSISHFGALTIENDVEIYDSIIEENDASKAVGSIGGGITLLNGNVTFKKDVNIIGNKAAKGGAIYTSDYSARKFIFGGTSTQSVLIKSNEAEEGGALYVPNVTGLTFIENTVFQENKGTNKGVIYYTGNLVLPDGIAFRKNAGKDLIYNETSGGSLTVKDIILTGNGLAGAAFRAKDLSSVSLNNVHRLTTNTFGSLLSAENCNDVTINNMVVGGSSFMDAVIVAKDNANGIKISSSSFIGNTVTNGAIALDNTVLKIQDDNLKVYDNLGPSNKNKDIYIIGGNAYVEPQVMLATTSRMGFSSKENGVLVFKGWDNGHIQGYNVPIQGRDYTFTPETSYELYASNDAALKGYELYKGETPGDVYVGSNDKFAKITFMNEDLTSTYTTQNIKKSSGSDIYTVKLNAVNTFECDISKQSWQIPKLDGTYQVVDNFNTSSAEIIATTNLIARYIKPHLHKDCGALKNEACVHENGIVHSLSDERTYKAVTSAEDIRAVDISSGYAYMYLLNDIVATESIPLPDGVIGICLNGFSFICSSASEAIFSVTTGGMSASNQLTITNCKEHGGFELEDGETVRQHEFLKTTGPLTDGGTLNVYNVTFGKETKHIKASSSLIYNEKGNVYTENLKLQYIDKIGDKGLLLTEGDKSYHHKLYVSNCNVDNLLVVDSKTEFGEIEISKNTVKNLLKVEGTDVKAKSIKVDTNTIDNNGIDIRSGNKFMVASTSIFVGNQTKHGAIIHIEDGVTDTLNLYKPVFDNNNVGTVTSDDAAIIAWDGELTLTDATFMNHTTTKPLIRNYKKSSSDNRDKLTLTNPVYINNTGAGDAIYLDNLDTGSKIVDLNKVNINGNNFKNLINVSSGSIILKNIDIDGGNYSGSVILADKMDDITFASVSIANTNSVNYAVNLTKIKVGLEEKININGNNKNIKLNEDAYFFMNGTSKLTKDSKLYVDVAKGKKIFEGWDENHVEGYRDLSFDAENPIHLYTPESSGIFNLEQGAANFNIYKKGIGLNTSVYAGKENEEYVVLKFKQKADPDPTECIEEYDFGSQNVAKGEETELDVVDSYEYEEYKQLWKAPDVGSIGHTETWCFMEPGGTVYYDVISTYSEAKTIDYYIRHIHRECGSKLNETCDHAYTYSGHDATYEYQPATDSVTFKDLLNTAEAQIVLKADITIEIVGGTTDYNFNNLKRLCLNGRRLTIKIIGSDYTSSIFNTVSHDLSICDCKKRKGYEGAISITNEGSAHLTKPFIQVSSNKVYITDVTFDKISIGNTSDGTLITAMSSGKAYAERIKVKNSTYIGNANGLFVSNSVDALHLYDAEFSHNSSGGSNNPMLVLSSNIKITTLSIIDNYKVSNTGVVGPTDTNVLVNGNVSLDTFIVDGNNNNSSIIKISDGSKLTLNNESIFENNQGFEGGVMNISGTLEANKDIIFRENQAGYGGAIYVSDNGRVIGLGTISFIRNKADPYGAAIYAKNAKENAFNFAKVIFDANTKGNGLTVDSVVEANGGVLKLVNPIFINHGTEVKSIIRNIQPNTVIKIENPIFKNNITENDAFYFEQIATDSEIIRLEKNNITGNKFKNLIYMNGTYKKTGNGTVVPYDVNLLTISGNIEDGEYIDSVITVKNTYDPGIPGDPAREELVSHVTLASLSIANNTISSGDAAVLLTGDQHSGSGPVRSGRVALKGKVVIDGNIGSKNLYISNENSWLQGADAYIDKESSISIKVYDADKPVFKGWKKENFENYDNPDSTLSPLTYTFTPDNSGIFKSANESLAIYKAGSANEDVYIGNDYVTLTWKNDFDDPEEEIITYCTQNVKKNEPVKLDVVNTFDYELYKQDWYDPTHNPRDNAFRWNFGTPSVSSPLIKTFADDTTIWYKQRHIHKECGQRFINPCVHLGGAPVHIETQEYFINDGYGENDVRQITTFTGEYLMLRGDITVNGPINIPTNIKGICLNGKTIKSDGVTGNLIDIGSGTLTICNCKEKGGIRIADQLTHNGNLINVSGSANVSTYNINYGYDPMDVPAGSDHETTKLSGSIMNVSGSANGYIERGKVSGFTMVGTDGLFNNTGSGNLILTDFNLIRNEISVNNDPLLKLNNNITLGTISIIENTVNGPVVEINGGVTLASINANNNKSINSAVISVPTGATLNLTGDTVISNDIGSKGGALYIAGIFDAGSNILFENNTAVDSSSLGKLYGGAVFIDEGGQFNVAGTAKFTKNSAKHGSSVYAYKAATDTFNVNHAEFIDENNEEGGVISWTGNLNLASISFISNHNGTGALIENDVNDYITGSMYTGLTTFNVTDIYMSDNTTEKDGIKLSDIEEVHITNLKTDNVVGTNKLDNVVNVESTNDSSVQNVFISNANISNTNYKNAAISILDGVNAVINNAKFNANNGTNYGAILVKGTGAKLYLGGDVFINNNISSGNYGAALTLFDKSNVDISVAATGDHFNISGNKSNGGAVYVDGKLGIEGKIIINGNTNNANQARNIYIANADSYSYGRGGAITADSRLGYTGFDNNTLVFKGWTTGIIPDKNNPVSGYCYTPENSGMFIKDQDAISNGKEFYKSGVMSNCSVKLGKEFAKLSFVTPNKLTTYCTQNIEKNVETELDKVTVLDSYGNYVTWVAPGINSQATENWVFESETYDAKYDTNKEIVKSYIYSVVFTGGTHSAEFSNDESIVRYGDVVAMPYWTTIIPGETFRAWIIRNPLQGMNPILHEGDNVSNLSLTENGIAYVDAAFVGEYYVKFIPNLEAIGLNPESINAIDIISHGEAVGIDAKFGNQGNYRLVGYNTKSDGTGTNYGIGSSVTPTDDICLYAQWVSSGPSPSPRNSGGGGSGGGGINSNGTIINGMFIPNGPGMFIEDEHRFTLKEDGSIVDEAGNVIGNIHIGDVLNADGSFTAANGITKYPDGRLKDKYGNIFNTDGSITLLDGNTYYTDGRMKDGYGNMIYPNGTIEFVDGTVKDIAGILHHLDGSLTTPDGIRYYLDGRVVLPDGTEVKKQNILVNNTEGDTIGNFVYEPNTNKYKFVSKDKAGNNVPLSDQWILKTDQSGKQKWYMVNHDGNMSTGWVKKDGEYYYMSKDVSNMGELTVGKQYINGKSYEFDNNGKLIKGDVPFGELDVIGATNHKLGVDGKWILDKDGIRKFMTKFEMGDGTVLDIPPSGWYMIDGSYYFFDISGKPLTGLIISDGKYYFLQEDGKMKEGGEVIVDGIKYTFDKATGACRTYTLA